MARPVGSTTRPQFHTYTIKNDRKAFVQYIRENYMHDPYLAKWYGDQMFGNAKQNVTDVYNLLNSPRVRQHYPEISYAERLKSR